MYLLKKQFGNGHETTLLTPFDIEYARRVVSITGEITDEVATALNSALRCLSRDSEEDIIIFLQSPGGSVSAGLSLYDTMQALQCDVCTVACGTVASMAAILLAAGTKGKRMAQPHAEILIHQPSGSLRGRSTDMESYMQHILKTRGRLNTILSRHTGQPIDKVAADTECDKIMDAAEALSYGLIDQIGDPISNW